MDTLPVIIKSCIKNRTDWHFFDKMSQIIAIIMSVHCSRIKILKRFLRFEFSQMWVILVDDSFSLMSHHQRQDNSPKQFLIYRRAISTSSPKIRVKDTRTARTDLVRGFQNFVRSWSCNGGPRLQCFGRFNTWLSYLILPYLFALGEESPKEKTAAWNSA